MQYLLYGVSNGAMKRKGTGNGRRRQRASGDYMLVIEGNGYTNCYRHFPGNMCGQKDVYINPLDLWTLGRLDLPILDLWTLDLGPWEVVVVVASSSFI